jgi:hypothetical protein
MNDLHMRTAAKQFADYWKGKGYEKGESQPFWMSLLSNVFGVENVEEFIKFEDKVMLDRTSFIDGNIISTHVLIEQKGLNKDLKKPIKQSDGTLLTPFQQAKRYASELPYSQRPRWIVTCNFSTFLVYDMENPSGQPEEILLENLPKEYYRLSFLVDNGNEHLKREMEISIKAGDLVGVLYDEFLKQYREPTKEHSLKSLNMLCVRLVFCLYAEDAGIFGKKNIFHDYLSGFDVRNLRNALISLFQVLDTPEENRDPYMDSVLAEFPYVNGGLFSDENIEIPQLTEEIRDLLLSKASDDFDWSEISPTIFGAVFESTLNPETRRSGGMHYTSIENIHKVIDSLFLDELRDELKQIEEQQVIKTKNRNLIEYQSKIAGLKFLDPACGSGNFLTETYLSLRRLENEVIKARIETSKGQIAGQITMGDLGEESSPIQVSIKQFYGIEINDFAVTVAKTALWIAESQMMKETEDVMHMSLDFLPLKSYANIIEGNALQINWESVVPKIELNYIMGNPPFVGKKEQTRGQKDELLKLFDKDAKRIGNLDYVSGWYIKAAQFMQNSYIKTAFVSTNSITQGEQVPILWEQLVKKQVHISFAHRTFRWDSEAKAKAHVHCVIIGFYFQEKKPSRKMIFIANRPQYVENINPYLINAPTVFIQAHSKPICDVPEMSYGSMPIDNGNLILNEEDVKVLLTESHSNIKFIREYVGGQEILQGVKRWCLWLDGANPVEYMKSKFIMGRIEATKEYRLKESTRPQTIKAAETPHLFGEIRQPNTYSLVIPKVSSEDRLYIPIAIIKPSVIINGSALMIPNATLYHFGILSSNIHNAWMRTVAGRLEMRYQYSANNVYNNFPWPSPTEEQVLEIKKAAAGVLKAREAHLDVSLADMYKEKYFLLFGDLKTAHDILNRAVMNAYGFSIKATTEESCVAELTKLYQYYVSAE